MREDLDEQLDDVRERMILIIEDDHVVWRQAARSGLLFDLDLWLGDRTLRLGLDRHHLTSFKALCAQNYTGVYDVGMKDTQKEVADMNDIELRGVTFSDMHVTHPNKKVADVIYKADVQGASKGKDFSGPYNCSSVWMNDKGGKWLCVLHTEVKVGTQ